jgi:site-specific DNA-methyltransferase (adenine-specific)
VDAVVCDPPYGLEFMGKEWDRLGDVGKSSHVGFGNQAGFKGFRLASYSASSNVKCGRCSRWKWDHEGRKCECGPDAIWPNVAAHQGRIMQDWHRAWATEALRVLKPGGHLLAFGGTRTFHRLTCGIEDAGFEVRDCLSWLYGSGFPKSLDVSKAIDKAAGAEREVVGIADGEDSTRRAMNDAPGNGRAEDYSSGPYNLTAPATADARKWQGWGTALKPAWEPCVLARKPLVGTVAANVQRHGTGALNIDGCRIPHGEDVNMDAVQRQQHAEGSIAGAFGASALIGSEIATYKPGGRWPANVAFDEAAAAMLDAQSGERGGGFGVRGAGREPNTYGGGKGYAGTLAETGQQVGYGDTGGASRFFYTAKASRADRNAGGMAQNTHPTVKPTDLMRWLVRLVTPPGGVVLDPFAGSGSTLVAARAEGVRAVGIEREDEYARIIADRLAQLSLFTEGME